MRRERHRPAQGRHRRFGKIQKIVRIEGYVHCAEGFRGHPQVLNGGLDLVAELFGERGQHTQRLGINEMPLNAAVQLAMTAEVAD